MVLTLLAPMRRRAMHTKNANTELRALLTRVLAAWKTGSGDEFASCFFEEPAYVTLQGEAILGRDSIASKFALARSHLLSVCPDMHFSIASIMRPQADLAFLTIEGISPFNMKRDREHRKFVATLTATTVCDEGWKIAHLQGKFASLSMQDWLQRLAMLRTRRSART